MSKSNERNPQVTSVHIGSRLSTMNAVLPGVYFRKKAKIKNVWLIDQAGVTKSSSNYHTITLQDNASSPVAYAAIATSASAAVALTPLALAYTSDSDSANSPEITVPAGTMLNVNCVTTGSAILTDAELLIEWYPL